MEGSLHQTSQGEMNAMYYNDEASNWMNVFCCRKNRYGYVQIENAIMNGNGTPHVLVKAKENGHADMNGHLKGDVQNVHYRALNIEEEIGEEESNDECCLTVANCFKKIWWLFTGPIDVILAITIPDCKREFWKRFYLLTFLMCILWIGFTSYVVAWMITTIGDTFQIPDSVMGLTFLAAGMSVPEAVSSVIVTNQGHGSMGISNSIGSNTFDILLCLGLPWLLKSALLPGETGGHFVQINSRGISYSVISLFTTLFLLYITFFLNNFKLDYKAGFVCLAIYIIFLVMASLIELDVFFPVNLPVCGR
ncbi:hypothetical protein C0J52_06132 [Blattella germanica]|nr:hypothetical protein C0J52_06132 [Blattella germanica]